MTFIDRAEIIWKLARHKGRIQPIRLALPDVTIFCTTDGQIRTFPTARMFEYEQARPSPAVAIIGISQRNRGQKRLFEVIRPTFLFLIPPKLQSFLKRKKAPGAVCTPISYLLEKKTIFFWERNLVLLF